jgi:hypothetical protein
MLQYPDIIGIVINKLHNSWSTRNKMYLCLLFSGYQTLTNFFFSTEKQLRRVEGLTISELLLTQNTTEFLIHGMSKSRGN